ncbi:MAG: HAMP domain-containing histidine kinase [Frankiales bacterium]|nr:HAMP domain-containing histidine kinase [Frankiales bacterium]
MRIAQRDEALRELLAQLALAHVAALAIAAGVGYRLARAALAPVDRYRARAAQIADGDQAVRLDVPAAPDDEITRLGHTLNNMLAAQAAAAERQRRFVADASHELRTPLSLLTTEVELALRRPRTNVEYEQTLRDVAADTARLSRLAEQLLALESGAPAGRSADLSEAVRRAAARGRAQHSAVQVDTLFPVPVAADDQQLDLLLGNLVDNAVRHGDGSAVTVRARRESSCAIATVSDDGPGLQAAFVPHAVERFRRADEARTTAGSGLGLALVHDLVVRLGGELRLCALGAHHTYPPDRFRDVGCEHPPGGTSVSLVLPMAG